jgi:hypothetical protein
LRARRIANSTLYLQIAELTLALVKIVQGFVRMFAGCKHAHTFDLELSTRSAITDKAYDN